MTKRVLPQIAPLASNSAPNEALISWAWEQQTHNSSSKFILVYMAFHANNKGIFCTDVGALARETALSPKTIAVNLKRLCEDGYLRDTSHRVSDSGRTVVYEINYGAGLDGIA